MKSNILQPEKEGVPYLEEIRYANIYAPCFIPKIHNTFLQHWTRIDKAKIYHIFVAENDNLFTSCAYAEYPLSKCNVLILSFFS